MKSTDTTPIETALRLQEARIAAQFELARHDSNRASQLTNIFSIAAAAAVPLAGSSFAEGNLPFALGFLVAGLIMGGAAAYCGFAGTMKHVRLVGIDKSDSSIISDIEYNTYEYITKYYNIAISRNEEALMKASNKIRVAGSFACIATLLGIAITAIAHLAGL